MNADVRACTQADQEHKYVQHVLESFKEDATSHTLILKLRDAGLGPKSCNVLCGTPLED